MSMCGAGAMRRGNLGTYIVQKRMQQSPTPAYWDTWVLNGVKRAPSEPGKGTSSASAQNVARQGGRTHLLHFQCSSSQGKWLDERRVSSKRRIYQS